MSAATMDAEVVTAAKIINQMRNTPSDTEVPEGVCLLSGVVYLLCGCINFPLFFPYWDGDRWFEVVLGG